MFNTVRNVFDIAINLLDAQQESAGQTLNPDTQDYAQRTPRIINSLVDECYPFSDTYPRLPVAGKRPVCAKVTTLDDPLDLDERICNNVLPYGLAGQLITEEDPARADFFWQTYKENLYSSATLGPAEEEAIVDVYGGLSDHGEFSQWK